MPRPASGIPAPSIRATHGVVSDSRLEVRLQHSAACERHRTGAFENQTQAAAAVADHAPQAGRVVPLVVHIGVDARQGALHGPTECTGTLVATLALAVGQRRADQPGTVALVEAEYGRGCLTVERQASLTALEARGGCLAPGRPWGLNRR